MKPSRLVALSYYFPPLVGIASDRAVARAQNLEQLGWQVTVVTTREGHYHTVDQPLDFDFPVIRTRGVELSRIARRLYASAVNGHVTVDEDGADEPLRPVATKSTGARLRRWIREWIYVPDAQVGWLPFAAIATARAAAGRDAVILSSSVPYSSHLAAWLAATLTRSPWVAEFRDPWTTAHESRLPNSPIRRLVDRTIERMILKRADHVIVTSNATRTGLLAAHPQHDPASVSVVMNGFVPSADRARPGPDVACCFVYAGTVAPGERPDAVLQAFARLETRAPGRFRFRVLGPRDPWIFGSSDQLAWLELEGLVTPAVAREAILESSAVILLQWHPAYHQVLSGKAFEYIGARRPVLAVLPPDSEMAEILREHADARIVSSYDVSELEAALEQLICEHNSGSLSAPTVSAQLTAPLTRDAQARILDQILRNPISK